MGTERLEILKMLSEGKINPEEAEMLLRALDEPPGTNEETESEEGRRKKRSGTFDRFTEVFSEVGKEIESEVGKALESVRLQDIGKMVNEAVDRATSSVAGAGEGWEADAEKRSGGQRQDWTFDAEGIARIHAETVNGAISVKGTEGNRIVVHAWKAVHGRRSVTEDFEREVEVRAERVGDEVRVTAEHPTPPGGVNVVIRYEIETPRSVDVRLSTVQGSIKIQGTDGAVNAESVNGSMKLAGDTGPIEVQTVNGSIAIKAVRLIDAANVSTTNGSIQMDVSEALGQVTATTNNGSVKLTLPSGFSGRIDAKTSHGRVRSDFPVAAERKSRGRLKGDVGDGGDSVVKLRSMNGSIKLMRRIEGTNTDRSAD